MFCIKCGKEAVFGNFCESCYLEKKELFTVKNIKIRYCDNCNQFYTQREKIAAENISDFLSRQIETSNVIKDIAVKVRTRPDKIDAAITCKGFVKPSKILITENKDFSVFAKKMKCDNCIKILGNYHEAVIQARGPQKEKILAKIERLIQQNQFADIVFTKAGYDIRVIEKSTAIRIAQALREKYQVKQSFKLVGEKKGKKIYRNFYSVR